MSGSMPDDAEGAKGPALSGAEVIAGFVRRLPRTPGVYRMIDAGGGVLYVGKARSLMDRVGSYTRPTNLTARIMRMVEATVTMEFVTTRTETEALLLEANLIKRLHPRYNVLLRDDKSFPYILITKHERAPAILKHRGTRSGKGDYFGPFASGLAVTRTVDALERAFLLRSCNDSYFSSRTRPCLLFQIKRCAAPCTHEISDQAYAKLVGEAKEFLSGHSQTIRARLAKEMEEASGQLNFEGAAAIRDRLVALSHVQGHQTINPRSVEEADVFACHQAAGQTAIEVFFFRTGQNWGNRTYFPRADKSLKASEVLGAFLAQFYDDKPVPRVVLLSHEIVEQDLLEQALSEKAERRVSILVPRRGEKRELVEHALANAREGLGRKLAETASQHNLLAMLGEKLGLAQTPKRIEIFDNSHISGTNAVGAMVVAGPEGFAKKEYRKFNIKGEDLVPGDDYGMMREVLTRRFARLLKESPRDNSPPLPESTGTLDANEDFAAPGAWPDLVILDGGTGQLGQAQAVLKELGIAGLPLLGIAKGPERDAGQEKLFLEGREPFMLQPRDPVLYFLQRLRDEAHRFAIGSHIKRRKLAFGGNPLDDIAGIGPARKRALLRHFGTAKAVAQAGLPDLLQVDGISGEMARIIYEHFRGNG